MPPRKRPPLTKKREQYVEQRATGILVGKPLSYPAGVADRYQRELDRMIRSMTKAYMRDMESLWRELGPEITQDASLASQARMALSRLQKRFEKLFRERAPVITDRMLGGVDKASAAGLAGSLKELSGGITLKTDVMPAALRESLKAAAIENVALIKSVATQYHDRIEGAVMRSIQQGGEVRKTVMDELREIGGMSERRARTIANDQVRKQTTAMNLERSKALGIKKARWLHSSAGVDKRQSHVAFNGKIFDLDNPPAIGDKGERVLPGQAINCRCTWVPVVEW